MNSRATMNGLIFLLVAGSVWSQDGVPVEAPLLKPNYSWTFTNVDGLTNALRGGFTVTITEVDDTSIRALSKGATTGKTTTFVFDRNLTAIRRDDEKIAFPVPRFQFPLIVGKKWEYRTESVHPQYRDTVNIHMEATVTGWEEVTVPAGKFRALRVDHEGRWSRSGLSGRITRKVWYAPELKYFVKYEIVDYEADGRINSSAIDELKASSIQ